MRKKRIKKRVVIVSTGILIVLLVVLLFIQYNVFRDVVKSADKIIIEGECSVVLDNLVQKVGSEADCKILCKYECDILDEQLRDYEFIENKNACNSCECYCK